MPGSGFTVGEPRLPFSKRFIFSQTEECVIGAEVATDNNGSFSHSIRSNLPSFSGPGAVLAVRTSAAGVIYNSTGIAPFKNINHTADYALANYQYGLVTKSTLEAHVRPLDSTNGSRDQGYETTANYTTDAEVYLTSSEFQFPHGASNAAIESNQADGLLRRQRQRTAIGATRQAIGSASSGCRLKQSYTPGALFPRVGGRDLEDPAILGNGVSPIGFAWARGGSSPEYNQTIVSGCDPAAYYTLTVTSKNPCLKGPITTGSYDGTPTAQPGVFAYGRIVPHQVTFILQHEVLCWNVPTTTLYLERSRLAQISRQPDQGEQHHDATTTMGTTTVTPDRFGHVPMRE